MTKKRKDGVQAKILATVGDRVLVTASWKERRGKKFEVVQNTLFLDKEYFANAYA